MPDVASPRHLSVSANISNATVYTFSGTRNVWDTICLDTNKALVLHSEYSYPSVSRLYR
jgi:hypothetical protein